ncbi:MAG: hypothetical protein QM791_12270 [Ferruginibacter sp.]
MIKILPLIVSFYLFVNFLDTGIPKTASIDTYTQDSTVKTKRYFKEGFEYRDDYKSGKLVRRRLYIGDKLMYESPLYKKDLLPSVIKLKSGKTFLSNAAFDTLEIINPQIPYINFGIEVKNVQLTNAGEKTYLIRAFNNSKTGIDTVKIYIKVYQGQYSRFNIPVFIADSVSFSIH